MEEKYTCLQDVLYDIYNSDENPMNSSTESYWIDIISKFVLNKKDLLQKLEQYFNMWDLGERGVDYLEKIGEFYEYERASWCFYYLFISLSFLKDPSFIPEVMKYFLPSGKDSGPWEMEDMWTESMLHIVTNYRRWGAIYIQWAMRSLHLLDFGADWAAEDLMVSMIFHTFYYITPNEFPDLPVVNALPLGNRDLVKRLLKKIIKHRKNCLLEHKDDLQANISVPLWRQTLVCAEYVLGQLLLLPEEVVGIGHR
ncbi:hypothetical protein P618_200280 [Holospora obtusa F1]|uniref:Uncharacterized protein n=1 Tax=Holospora obtusa F1 TaxID=1399147 RepID=W6TF10_HOLOB|nr:hypothetical protein [Holospora obtusa]ETZ07519.1 hypothetical protein P618_200280 [Holospora obtusa F1]